MKELYEQQILEKSACSDSTKMLKCREEIEAKIWLLFKQGNSYFWLDNWTGLGALYKLIPPGAEYDQTIVLLKEVAEVGQWEEQTLRNLLPYEVVEHIIQNICLPEDTKEMDRPYWKLESKGEFTVTSAFHHVRQRQEVNKVHKLNQILGAPMFRQAQQLQ
ncbi:hypothetical protein KY290_000807 [Solanum tuberosum]|uniref:Uncharacterized protein n=1 Tax=Solanum tuberosum TaxID=4113 RepID=A0ABQ7WKD2_SOLTU|nr:hypothetical protein KY289_000879 [Solanum tuberosum]KAH0781209.1 hypothetical protein KY290_000807 [Solanum tuberosum]